MHVRKQGNVKTYYSSLGLLWVAARSTLALSQAALCTPADLIHIGKPHPMNGIAGFIAKIIQGKRGLKLWLDVDDIEAEINRFGAGWQKKGVDCFERWLPRRMDGVTTHTSINRERLLGYGVPAERLHHLSNGIDRTRFAPPDPQQVSALRHKLGLDGKAVIVYVGSLSLASHPVDLLLEAFRQVADTLPEARLLLAGGGEDYERLQIQAHTLGVEAKVLFCGRIPPSQVVLYYYLGNVSVDPLYDNTTARGRLPLKLFESWACGVPFITADVGDRRQLLGIPAAGLLTHPGEIASLAAGITDILTQPDLAATLAERGRARAEEYYWDRLVKQLETLYKQC